MKYVAAVSFFLMGLGVALGAFGAHALKDFFQGREEEIWKTAVFYQITHALALQILVVSEKLSIVSTKIAVLTSRMLALGIFIFCGSLYLLVLTHQRWLGAITPIGGVLLIGSWLILTWKACRK